MNDGLFIFHLSPVKDNLPSQDFCKVIHAVITSCLDDCNSLYFGLSSRVYRLNKILSDGGKKNT